MAKLEENTSLVTALTEIEKKVGQAENDRNALKTNLSTKGVNVSDTDKMQGLVEKVNDIKVIPQYMFEGETWLNLTMISNPSEVSAIAVTNDYLFYSCTIKGPSQGRQGFYNLRTKSFSSLAGTHDTVRGNCIGMNNEIFCMTSSSTNIFINKFSFVTYTWTEICRTTTGYQILDPSLHKCNDNSFVHMGDWVGDSRCNGHMINIVTNAISILPKPPSVNTYAINVCSDGTYIYLLKKGDSLYVYDISEKKFTKTIKYVNASGSAIQFSTNSNCNCVLKDGIAYSSLGKKINVNTGEITNMTTSENLYQITADFDNDNFIYKIGDNGFGFLLK